MYANNKGEDQLAHLHSLIGIHSLGNLISKLASCKISNFLLVFVAEQTKLNLNWSQTPGTGFSCQGRYVQGLHRLEKYLNIQNCL